MKSKYETLVYWIAEKAEAAEDYAIIRYGLFQGMVIIGFILISAVICCVFKNGIEGIAFLIPFYFLRTYAGGYHAKTRKKCWCISIGAMAVINCYLRIVPINFAVEGLLGIGFAAHLYLKAPVECKNKPLSSEEKQMYRKVVRKTLAVYIGIIMLSFWLKNAIIYRAIYISVALSDVLIWATVFNIN